MLEQGFQPVAALEQPQLEQVFSQALDLGRIQVSYSRIWCTG
jgi:hypothetical protein